MKVAVDTNVLVRILTHDNRRESDKAEELVRSNDLIIPNQTLCEMVWVLRPLYDFGAGELVKPLRAFPVSRILRWIGLRLRQAYGFSAPAETSPMASLRLKGRDRAARYSQHLTGRRLQFCGMSAKIACS